MEKPVFQLRSIGLSKQRRLKQIVQIYQEFNSGQGPGGTVRQSWVPGPGGRAEATSFPRPFCPGEASGSGGSTRTYYQCFLPRKVLFPSGFCSFVADTSPVQGPIQGGCGTNIELFGRDLQSQAACKWLAARAVQSLNEGFQNHTSHFESNLGTRG